MKDKVSSPSFQINDRELNQILLFVETSHNHVRKLIELNAGLIDCLVDLISGSRLQSPPRAQDGVDCDGPQSPLDYLF
jgi:hypothetical protein